MKKSKIIALAVLSVILCLMLICYPSFSWFTRGTQTGGYFKWSNNSSETALSYNTSNGDNIKMATYSSPDGKTYGDNVATSFSENSGISAGARKYYRTDITNSGNTDQSVSLYLANLKTGSSGSFYLGVNSPLRTYKNYSYNEIGSNKIKSEINKKSVYVGIVTSQSPNPTDFAVHYWTKTNEGTYNIGDAWVGSKKYADSKEYTVNRFNNYKANYNMYVATIPYSANGIVLQKSGEYFDGGDNTDVDYKNTILWYHYDNAYHTDNAVSDTSAGINTFYSDATVMVGEKLDIKADCRGKSIQYESSNNKVVTVDSDGIITGVSAGTATITVKAYGIYGDCLTAECVVTVGSQSNEVPVITNLSIPAKSGEKDSVVSVYWYIKNDSESGNLTYTVDDLYISL